MVIFPNAKINLGLHVTEKRTDGYHNIETIFYPVKGFNDVIEVIENRNSKQDTLNVTGLFTKPVKPEENLVIKALQLLRADHDIPPVQIHLHKTIPSGAGLGGGSSDAAFMLKLLNKKFKLGISNEDLQYKASKLGADCAFFILNTPTLAKGIGDQFFPVNISLKNFWIHIVVPPVSISTPEAYKTIIPVQRKTSLATLIEKPLDQWPQNLTNDFEKNIFQKHSEIETAKSQLYRTQAIYASMSGSGSALYGIFREEPHTKWPANFLSWKGRITV